MSNLTNIGLNDVQLTLLRLFNRPISQQETEEIKDLLVKHLWKKLDIQIEEDIQKKGLLVKILTVF
jgi:hypothetical protein